MSKDPDRDREERSDTSDDLPILNMKGIQQTMFTRPFHMQDVVEAERHLVLSRKKYK
jgi:hypothetical protein